MRCKRNRCTLLFFFAAEMADFRRVNLCIYFLAFSLGVLLRTSESKVIELTEDNWKQILEGEWMVKFYAPWCPACRHIAPAWSAFAVKGKQLDVNVAKVDVTVQSALSGRFLVSSLPTIYHVKDGNFRVYKGSRAIDEFVNFVQDKKWQDVEAISSWKSPSSFLMGGLGLVFKLSIAVKDLHDHITTTYGLPAWASFVIFGVVTILAGILLGVGTVYIADYFFDKPQPRRQPVPSKKDSDDEDTKDDNSKGAPSEQAQPQDEKSEDAPVRKRKLQATTD